MPDLLLELFSEEIPCPRRPQRSEDAQANKQRAESN